MAKLNQGMQQNDLLLAMDSILSKYVLSEKGMASKVSIHNIKRMFFDI